jgi:hypothetical protein
MTISILCTVDVGPEPTPSESEHEGAEDDDDDDQEEEDDDNDDEDDDDEAEFEDDEVGHPKSDTRHRSSTGSGGTAGGTESFSFSTNAVSNATTSTALDARAKLAANLLLLTGPELGHVISRLEQACPAALEILAPDSKHAVQAAAAVHNSKSSSNSNARPCTAIPGKMEIVLDLVEAPLLKELSEYAVKATAHRKRGRMALAAAAEAASANNANTSTSTKDMAAQPAAGTGSTENTASGQQQQQQVSQQGGEDGMEIDDITNKRKRKK